jgi:hypothetical protein
MRLIYIADEVLDDDNYTDESIEALLEEYDECENLTELTIDDKCDILDYDKNLFDRKALLKSYAYSFYSYIYNRHYTVISDGHGYCIFEIDNY